MAVSGWLPPRGTCYAGGFAPGGRAENRYCLEEAEMVRKLALAAACMFLALPLLI